MEDLRALLAICRVMPFANGLRGPPGARYAQSRAGKRGADARPVGESRGTGNRRDASRRDLNTLANANADHDDFRAPDAHPNSSSDFDADAFSFTLANWRRRSRAVG